MLPFAHTMLPSSVSLHFDTHSLPLAFRFRKPLCLGGRERLDFEGFKLNSWGALSGLNLVSGIPCNAFAGGRERRTHQEMVLRDAETLGSETENGGKGLELDEVDLDYELSGWSDWEKKEDKYENVMDKQRIMDRVQGKPNGGREDTMGRFGSEAREDIDDDRRFEEKFGVSSTGSWNRKDNQNSNFQDTGRGDRSVREYDGDFRKTSGTLRRYEVDEYRIDRDSHSESFRRTRIKPVGTRIGQEWEGNREFRGDSAARRSKGDWDVDGQTAQFKPRGESEYGNEEDGVNTIRQGHGLDKGGMKFELDCQHFERCSGCTLANHLDEPPILGNARRFFGNQGIDSFRLITGDVWDWRCRAKLAVRGTPEDPQIGLFEEGSHRVVDIPSCKAHHPALNSTAQLVREAVKHLGIQPYDEDRGTGSLRYIQMVLTTHNTALPSEQRYAQGKVQLSLVWNARDEKSIEANMLVPLAEEIWKRSKSQYGSVVHSIWANFQTTRTNVIFGGRWRCLLGEQVMWHLVGSVDVAFTPGSFGQANYKAFEVLLSRLHRGVPRGSSVTELYAGTGVIGLTLAQSRNCRRVRCIEVNKACMSPFEQSLHRLPSNVASRVSWHCADAATTPIKWLEGSDVVVVDPPRKGLDPPVIEALRLASERGQGKAKQPSAVSKERAEKRPWLQKAGVGASDSQEDVENDEGIWPRTLIYVSCGWEAFKQDCLALTRDDAWHLSKAQAVQFFPGTDSMETLAIFKRGKKPRDKKQGAKSPSKTGKKFR